MTHAGAEGPPAYDYSCAWLGGWGGIELPTEEEAAMGVPSKDVRCVVKVVALFHTSYYDVVGCTSATLIYRERA